MAGIYNFLYILVITMFTIVTAADYCNMKSCSKKGDHTMCKYSSKPAKECGQTSRTGLTDKEKKEIVDKHNELRQKVASGAEKRGNPGPQPKAVSMSNVTWDKELEEICQRWVNQCISGHDKCRGVDRFTVGQNMARVYSKGNITANMTQMILSWYNEVNDFNNTKVEKYEFDSKIGHYSQLIWNDTSKIGCGIIEYKDSAGWNNIKLGCNYGSHGNVIGQKIYKIKK
ncbi:PREDICTED: venom allergen 3-like isoform X2 [Trachymyrmex cornetzi]|uniref:venom allergen 3-like isoform X2 n=1 Tax=Trachymyrmex cornetzi TaxID=471704 RepID=UPI00084F805A|nr:PREDICTED: venom allergen 3-like isoform X2 [Trachymyrmex cornetzi]